MKKYLLSTVAFALTAFLSASSHAECDGIYAAFRAGVVEHDVAGDTDGMNSDTIQYDDKKLMLSGALGYRYKHFRTEFEYIWRDYVDGNDPWYSEKYKTYSYMLNAYWDFRPYHWWSCLILVLITNQRCYHLRYIFSTIRLVLCHQVFLILQG